MKGLKGTFQLKLLAIIHVVDSFASQLAVPSHEITQRCIPLPKTNLLKKLAATKTQDRQNKIIMSYYLYRRVQVILPVDVLHAAAKNENILGGRDDSSVPQARLAGGCSHLCPALSAHRKNPRIT